MEPAPPSRRRERGADRWARGEPAASGAAEAALPAPAPRAPLPAVQWCSPVRLWFWRFLKVFGTLKALFLAAQHFPGINLF